MKTLIKLIFILILGVVTGFSQKTELAAGTVNPNPTVLSRKNADKTPLITQDQTPLAVVVGYLEAVKAMNPEQMNKQVADDYKLVPTDGPERLYNQDLAYPITDWERGMNTRWSYEIINEHQNTVTVISTEKNDFFTLLGLGQRTQVSEYSVEGGKIIRSVSKVVVERFGTQSDAYRKFTSWLFSQPELSEPDLIDSNNRLIFNGKSAPRMLYWLRKWDSLKKTTKE